MKVRHNSPGSRKEPAPTLDEELAIRQALPRAVVEFALGKLHSSFGWFALVDLVRARGEAGALESLRAVNALDHEKHYGRAFYRGLSPWRNY